MRVILNPMARNGGGRRLRAGIERELERRHVDFDLVVTEGPGHATELARDATDAGIRSVIAAGGDGTVHEVANGIMAAEAEGTRMGLLPIGTGNDFVKMVPGTGTMQRALDTLQRGDETAIDVGVARWDDRTEYFINAMGTGIDVEVVRQMRRRRLVPGAAIYLAALARALARYTAMAVEVDVDGRATRGRIMNLAVCNGPSIGGSFRICPDASPADGLLDVCIIAEMPMLRNARMVPRVLRGTHPGQQGVTMLRGAAVKVRLPAGGPLLFQLDGELREAADGAAGVYTWLAPRPLTVIGSAPRRAASAERNHA